MQTPHIFTVMAWRLEGDTRRLDVHYVAGLSSADAEARIKERNSYYLHGQCFITTDEFIDHYGDDSKLFTNHERNQETTSEREFRQWRARVTRGARDDDSGDYHPAAFRRFHIENSRARRAQAAA